LYVALDQDYINEAQFAALCELIDHARSKIGGLIVYLLKSQYSE